MKYICLGYGDEAVCRGMSAEELQRYRAACKSYEDRLRAAGQFLESEVLQAASTAVLVRLQQGELCVAGRNVGELSESLGAILTLEARDLNHAVQLLSLHPGVGRGVCFEVRPALDANAPGKKPTRLNSSQAFLTSE